MTPLTITRSLLSTVIGLVTITAIVEGVEIVLVAAIHGGFDVVGTAEFLTIRNSTGVLWAKFLYTFLAAGAGGYLAAWVAPARPFAHGIALAVIQAGLFLWGMLFSPFAGTLPVWSWSGLALLIVLGILAGARLRADHEGQKANHT